MTKRTLRKLPRQAAPAPKPDSVDTQPDDALPPDAGIPAHVWATLQEAGEEAAQRLLELLDPVRFNKLAGSVQRALLDLALTRAYGLPVRRSVNVSLTSDDADAVAASLQDLRDSLPERRPEPRDITPTHPEPREQ